MHFVNKFETEICRIPEARKKAYFTRFVSGLPDDYIDFIEQKLYGNKRTVEHALKVSQQFKTIKDRNAGTSGEVAGAAYFHGNYGNERIVALEQEIARLKTRYGSPEESNNNPGEGYDYNKRLRDHFRKEHTSSKNLWH